MKTFLIFLALSTTAFAQTTTTSLPASTGVATSPMNSSMADVSSFSLSKVKSKFKVNYFSETLGPTLVRWDDNEFEDDGMKKREPMTMYHSFNVRYLLTEKFNLFMSPRFSTVIGDRNDLRPTQEQHVFYSDDWQFGVYYTFVKTQNFQYNQRLTHREPFSNKSRFEKIDSQIEWQHDLTYAPTAAFRIIHWNNYRYYAYNEEADSRRWRINFTTLFNYVVADKWNIQYMHELDLQHRSPKVEGEKGYRRENFLNPYKHYNSFGIGYSPIPTLTFIPFIRAMDPDNIRNETTMVGLWVLGKVI